MYDISIRCPASLTEVPSEAPSYVNSMESMFEDCIEFDGDLSQWNLENVTTTRRMFKNTPKFTGKGLGNWNTSNVTDMSEMFMNSSIKE